jgi:hypothetical protein
MTRSSLQTDITRRANLCNKHRLPLQATWSRLCLVTLPKTLIHYHWPYSVNFSCGCLLDSLCVKPLMIRTYIVRIILLLFYIYNIYNSVAPEPEVSSPHSKQLATGPYPEPAESTPHPFSKSPQDLFWFHSPIYASIFRVVSFHRAFPPKPRSIWCYMYISTCVKYQPQTHITICIN